MCLRCCVRRTGAIDQRHQQIHISPTRDLKSPPPRKGGFIGALRHSELPCGNLSELQETLWTWVSVQPLQVELLPHLPQFSTVALKHVCVAKLWTC